ncbi:hypothetical protein [Nocardia farcinica]|uniref:hypothetical protein n=1 Tax=Nocardia farcinica TaxID=37329 RepID=UPI0024547E3B|nr:hypothetical protein [Nocardia farcinica]
MSAGKAGARIALAALTAASVVAVGAGCGQDPREVTCSEFAAMSFDEQNDTLDDLLSAHDLETLSASNAVGVRQRVDSFCGTNGSSSEIGGRAGRNGDSSIDDAVDWESGTW